MDYTHYNYGLNSKIPFKKKQMYLFEHFLSPFRNITIQSQQPLGLLNELQYLLVHVNVKYPLWIPHEKSSS